MKKVMAFITALGLILAMAVTPVVSAGTGGGYGELPGELLPPIQVR